MGRDEFLAAVADDVAVDAGEWPSVDPEAIAVLLFTSGTTGEPKAAVLRHRHLASYVIATVEFMGAADDEAALVSVPAVPHRRHVGGADVDVLGRRIVYLEAFDARGVGGTTARRAARSPTPWWCRPCSGADRPAGTEPTMALAIAAAPVLRRRPHAGGVIETCDGGAAATSTSSTPTA